LLLTGPTTSCRSDLADLSLDELEDELATLASHIHAGTCRWLELVAELDRRGSRAESGCGSCAEWLAWRCALLPRAAREHVRVARRLAELPLVQAAFSRGELSYAKVRALTRVADPDSEGELLQLASTLTAAQLERAVRAYRRVTTQEARDVHEHEHLSSFWDEDGALVVRARLAPEDVALFLRALEAARDQLWRREGEHDRGSAEPRRPSRRPTNVDALVAMADAALGREPGRSGSERYQVVVHVDEAILARDDEHGCGLEEGPPVAPETARRLACDASIVRVSERRGGLPSVGRRTRTIPSAVRRALAVRDRGCRFPGGETALDNLVLLCRRHHRLVHEGGYAVDPRMRFYDPHGRPIPSVARPPRDRIDLVLAVAALCQIARDASAAAVEETPRSPISSNSSGVRG
jgi:hypothetical protein